MSRVAKVPVAVPAGVDVQLADGVITVKGSLGTLTQKINPLVAITREGAELLFKAADESRGASAMSGTFRALVANMVQGVTKGFEKKLQLVGTGYRAQAQGASLNLSLGFSHPVVYKLPEGVTAATPTQVEIMHQGI
jgi:large subunit ribosomal protein L6